MNVNTTSPEAMYYPDKIANPDRGDAECDWCENKENVSYHAKMRRNLCESCWEEADREIESDQD